MEAKDRNVKPDSELKEKLLIHRNDNFRFTYSKRIINSASTRFLNQ